MTADADGQWVPAGISADDWADIRSAHADSQHEIVRANDGHRARNPRQSWTVRFDGRGFNATPDTASWAWGLELDRYGWGDATCQVEAPRSRSADGNRFTYTWDEQITEWYINDSRGIEHGYTIHQRPQDAAGAFVLDVRIRGGLVPVLENDARDIRFSHSDGGAALTYCGLTAFDADGRNLAARWEIVDNTTIRLHVDDAGATYPLTIDPIAQQAYLKASNTDEGDRFGRAVAISGNTIVVGATDEASSATGVNGDQDDNSTLDAGAAYVFVRDGSTWSQQAYLKASNTDADDRFGGAVAISGDTIVIGAVEDDSSATGVNGDQGDNSAQRAGAAYVFVRDGSTWSQQAYLKASNTDPFDGFGGSVAISGETIVVGATGEDSSATGVNGNEDDDTESGSGAAYVFVRNGSSWEQQAYLKASNTDGGDGFGTCSISGDTIVVGARNEDSSATGVNGEQNDERAFQSGAAYVFTRDGATWSQQAYLKASNPDHAHDNPDEVGDAFGTAVSLSGDLLIIGAEGESSSATGVNGDQFNNDTSIAGAAYLFVRDGTTWSQLAYLKASNTVSSGWFGSAVGLSDGTIVVGAHGDRSNATGVDGDPFNMDANNSGAAFVFVEEPDTSCPADFDRSGSVDVSDLLVLLSAWGTPGGDLNDDGITDVTDLLALFAAWGPCS